MQIRSIENAVDWVKTAGAIALQAQQGDDFVRRSYKADGSVLTEIDKRVEDYMVAQILEAYPQANIVTEETPLPFDPAKAYTFALDPIDGTDVFSLGMPGWCVSLGLLDRELAPVAGILYSPRLDLLLFADLGQPLRGQGCEIVPPRTVDLASARSSLMASSRIHRHLDLGPYVGKVRSIGSAALHLSFPLIYPTVDGALQHRGVHIWDLAGAHALLRSHGLDLAYLGGQPVDYGPLLDGSATREVIVAGSSQAVEGLRRLLPRH